MVDVGVYECGTRKQSVVPCARDRMAAHVLGPARVEIGQWAGRLLQHRVVQFLNLPRPKRPYLLHLKGIRCLLSICRRRHLPRQLEY